MQAQVLTFIIPGMMAIFCAILLGFWWQDRSRLYILGFAYWAFSFCGSIILQGAVPFDFAPYDILLFHWNAAIGLLALLWGVSKRDGEPFPLLAMLGVTIVATPILYYSRIYEQQGVLLMTQNFCSGLFFALAAQNKWRAAPINGGDRVLLYVFLTLAAYAMIRPTATTLAQSQMTMAEYQASIFASANIVVSSLLALILVLTLVAMLTLDNMRIEREGATIDVLTKLPNRGAFEMQVEERLQRAQAERIEVSLLVGDIDHFKRVNDTWGHSAGDRVIAAFGSVLQDKIRPGDVAGRIGGEEFCVLVWNCSGTSAMSLANRLRLGFSETQIAGFSSDERFTASFGVAQWQVGESYSDVFRRADDALFSAKRAGRDRAHAASLPSVLAAVDTDQPFRQNEEAADERALKDTSGFAA